MIKGGVANNVDFAALLLFVQVHGGELPAKTQERDYCRLLQLSCSSLVRNMHVRVSQSRVCALLCCSSATCWEYIQPISPGLVVLPVHSTE